jgi:hypothetical protein
MNNINQINNINLFPQSGTALTNNKLQTTNEAFVDNSDFLIEKYHSYL